MRLCEARFGARLPVRRRQLRAVGAARQRRDAAAVGDPMPPNRGHVARPERSSTGAAVHVPDVLRDDRGVSRHGASRQAAGLRTRSLACRCCARAAPIGVDS